MTTNYTPLLQLALPTTGELDGTWGDVVNQNITAMVEQAIAGRSEISTWTANSHTLTVANGTTDEARCAILDLKPGSGGTAISGAGQVICPATSKVYVVSNNTGYLITFKTAAGTGVDIANATSMLLVCNGTNVIQGVTQNTGAGIPVGSGILWKSENTATSTITLGGNVYQRTYANVAYDPALHDLATLKTNAAQTLCYGSYQVTGTSTNFNWVTYSASLDLYVAVGSSSVGLFNTIYTSPDAATWTARNAPVTTALNYVIFANSLFIAAGASGTILTSPDGITWTQRTSNTAATLTGATYSASDNKFVVVGNVSSISVILTSPDGITWTKVLDGQTLRGIAYSAADDTYVAVGDAGAIYTSPDGASWTYRTSGVTTALNAVAYSAADDIFVAVGASGVILTSAEGVTWTVRSSGTTNALNGVTYSAADDLFVVVGASGTVVTSPNGTSWTVRTSPTTAQLNAVAYSAADDVYVAVGAGGVAIKSSDGITWTLTLNNQQVNGIAYSAADAIYVAVGAGGAIWTSADTVVWSYQQSGVTTALQAVAYSSADDKFVAVGASGVILSSPDGVTWTARSSGTANALYGVAYSAADDIFVAVGASGTIVTSPDGITWTARTSNTSSQLNAVAYDSVDDKFVAVGAAGTIIYSADGVTWTVGATTAAFNAVAYSSGLDLYVAVCDSGLLYTSPDQAAWTKRTSGVATALNGVCWSSDFNLFIAVGASGVILTSPDGVTWTSRTSGVAYALYSVAAGNSIVVAVGGSGTAGQYAITKSTNGTTYAAQTTLAFGPATLYSVGFYSSSNTFVAGGACTSTPGYSFIGTSTDGATWTQRFGGMTRSAIEYGSANFGGERSSATGTVVICGNGGGVTVKNSAFTQSSWKQLTASFDATIQFYNAAYSASLGMFLVCGTAGRIYTSTDDGVTWTSQTSGIATDLYVPKWDASLGLFIVAGASRILTSPDGVTWTSRLSAGGTLTLVKNTDTNTYYAIGTNTYTSTNGTTWTDLGASGVGPSAGQTPAYFTVSGKIYLYSGNSGLYSSSNGTTWTSLGGFGDRANTVIASPTALVVLGGGGGSTGTFYVSTDGTNFSNTYTTYSAGRCHGGFYDSTNSRFIGLGNSAIYSAPQNGASWSVLSSEFVPTGFAYNSSSGTAMFASYAGNATNGFNCPVYTSNGTTWNLNNTQYGTAAVNDCSYDSTNNIFISCGGSGYISTSSDAITWTTQTSNTTSALNAIIANSTDGIMAMGAGNIRQRSTNGTTWTLGYAGGTPNALNGVCYGAADDRVVAVGAAGNILTSPDGIAWTYVTPPTTNAFNAVTYDSTNDQFIAVGASGTIYTSPEAVTWTARTSNTTNALTSAYFDTTVKDVVGGATGTLLASTNATTWVAGVISTAQNLLGVTYGSADDKIVVVGAAGTILTSPDGSAWTARSSGVATSINAVCYDSTTDLFCAVAYSLPNGAPAFILTSPDGITWTQRSGAMVSTSSVGPLAITSTSTDGFVAVGSGGTAIKSADGINWNVTLYQAVLARIAYSSSLDKFVVVGGGTGASGNVGGYIMTSSDALTWTVTKADLSWTTIGQSILYSYNYAFNDVAFDSTNGIFVAAGSAAGISNGVLSYVYTSSDGVSWTKRLMDTNVPAVGAIVSGNGVTALICGILQAGTTIVTSTDGVTWSASMGTPITTAGQVFGACYGSDIQKFVLCAGLGVIYISNTSNAGSPTSVSANVSQAAISNGPGTLFMRTK